MKSFLATILALASAGVFAQSAEVLNPDVRQDTINETICQRGYTKSVRPAVSYTNGVKKKLMRERGIDESRIHEFELDHWIALEIGGHPRSIENLKLVPIKIARCKDKVEHRLHADVCSGKLSLSQAQDMLNSHWEEAHMRYFGQCAALP